MNNCPNCQCRYSATLPIGRNHNRCRLPLSLGCGHCICYTCCVNLIFSGDTRTSSFSNPMPLSCSLCLRQTTFLSKDFDDVIPLIDIYQLGLIQLAKMKTDIIADKIKLTDNNLDLQNPSSFMHQLQYSNTIELSKVKMPELHPILEETIHQLNKTSNTSELIKRQSSSIRANYDNLTLEVEQHFALLHTALQGREKETLKQLDSSLHNQLKILSDSKRWLSQYFEELINKMDKAKLIVDNFGATIQNIFKTCLSSSEWICFLDNLTDFLERIEPKTAMNPNPDFLSSLNSPQSSIVSFFIDDQQSSYWKELENLVQELVAQSTQHKKEAIPSPSDPVSTQLADTSSPELANLVQKLVVQSTQQKKEAISSTGDPVSTQLTDTPSPVCSELCTEVVDESKLKKIEHRPHKVGKILTGIFSHIESREYGYFQVLSPSFEIFHTSMQKQESVISDDLNFQFQTGQYCAARYSVDNHWYRGLIEKKQDDIFLVYFIDYGNRELTSTEFLRPPHESFYELPPQAVYCRVLKSQYNSLGNFQNPLIAVKVELVCSGQIGRFVMGEELTLAVSLVDSPVLPTDVKEGGTRLKSDSESNRSPQKKVLEKKKNFLKSSSLETNMALPPVLAPAPGGDENRHKIRVTLANFVSPNEFYLRTEDSHLAFVKLCSSLRAHFDSLESSANTLRCELKVDRIYAVEHSGTWYRCKLETLTNDEAIVLLVDLGTTIIVTAAQLRRLENQFQEERFLVFRCSMWGLKPAGHVDKWSRASYDKMTAAFKMASKLFMQIYHKTNDTLFIRFFYEFLKPGGALECDTYVTTCLNDELIEMGLALRLMMPLSRNQLSQWLPCKTPPLEFDAVVSWVDEEGAVFLHLANESARANMETIIILLNSYLAKSTTSIEEHWEKDQLCVFRSVIDQRWHRARVLEADNENRMASVFLVDYGKEEAQVPYDQMYRTLLGTEYPVQAVRCWMMKYPADQAVSPEEIEELRRLLLCNDCHVKIISSSDLILKVDLKLVCNQSTLDTFIGRCQPPIVAPDTLDVLDELLQNKPDWFSADDLTSTDQESNFSDPMEVETRRSHQVSLASDSDDVSLVFPTLDYPLDVMLPVEIVAFLDGTRGVIQPRIFSELDMKHELGELEKWERQTVAFRNMHDDLQRNAPLLPHCEIIDTGSSCVARHPVHNLWYRGIIKGYADDSLQTVLIELVDLGVSQVVNRVDVKQLACQYSNLPRHSLTVRLLDRGKRFRQKADQLFGYFQEKVPEPEMRVFFLMEGIYSEC